MKRNPHLTALKPQYLFPEIQEKVRQFLYNKPGSDLLFLSVGDTSEPLYPHIVDSLISISKSLGTREGYVGYGPEQGITELKKKIAFSIYKNRVPSEDIFISDGANSDLARLQTLFGSSVSIAIQDPTYPVYEDGSIIQGVKTIVRMPCTVENNFFPDLEKIPRTDLIYFCSPNNPTGVAATKTQLLRLVEFAKANQSIIIFDAAYSCFVKQPTIPKSIYEIDGAKEVAIEVNSFSKMAGFTGVRLGWCVVPNELKYDNGLSVRSDWDRLVCTLFNGASIISQKGGFAALDRLEMLSALSSFYLENAALLKAALEECGYTVYGGIDGPYLWVCSKEGSSWDLFYEFLNKYCIVTIPGSGFGNVGNGFIRISAFGSRSLIQKAVLKFKNSNQIKNLKMY